MLADGATGSWQDGADHCLRWRHAVSLWHLLRFCAGLPACTGFLHLKLMCICNSEAATCLHFDSALGVGKPALVVVPLSTLPNWMAELATWAPHLNAVALHGNDAARKAVKKYELYTPMPQGKGRATKASLQVALACFLLRCWLLCGPPPTPFHGCESC